MGRFLLLTFLPLLHAATPDFDENLARNVMMPLASASYAQDPQPCLDYKMPGAKVSMRVEVPCDDISTDTCSAFTMIDETRGVIAITFRGTSTNEQLADEISTTLKEKKIEFRDGGLTSPYFATAFDDLWFNSGIGADFNYLANKYPKFKGPSNSLRLTTKSASKTRQNTITGHSLGGSFASLATVHILQNKLFPKEQTTFYSFGEPRTGDVTFSDLIDSLTVSYRVVHNKDVIPHVPFINGMEYHHHNYEVYYPNDMTEGSEFEICYKKDEEAKRKCSEKNGKDLVFKPDHLYYYNEQLLHFGVNECKWSDPPNPPQ